MTVRLAPQRSPGTVVLSLGGVTLRKSVEAGANSVVFEPVPLTQGESVLECEVVGGGTKAGALDVTVTRLK
jgi:hypothetical protein